MPKENLTIEHTEKENFQIIKLIGRLDSDNVQNFRNATIDTLRENSMVIDMTNLEFLSSTGVGNLIELNETAEKNNNKFILLGVQKNVLNVLKLTGFLDIFNLIDTFDQIN